MKKFITAFLVLLSLSMCGQKLKSGYTKEIMDENKIAVTITDKGDTIIHDAKLAVRILLQVLNEKDKKIMWYQSNEERVNSFLNQQQMILNFQSKKKLYYSL